MANALYDKGREKFLNGDLSWRDGAIKVVLVDTEAYTVNLAVDEFLSSIPLEDRIATSSNLVNKTSVAGVADAGNVTFPSVSGDVSEAVIIYLDTGNAATSPLIAYIDTATGLPVTPNGGDITVTWNASGIFKL
jgi:hypothetical protein